MRYILLLLMLTACNGALESLPEPVVPEDTATTQVVLADELFKCPVTFTWAAPTEDDLAMINIYITGVLGQNARAIPYSLVRDAYVFAGRWTAYATYMDMEGRESVPSNTVTGICKEAL